MAENQLLDASNDPRLQIGANFPPPSFSEQLREELAPQTLRSVELIELASKAVIIDEDSASKVVNLSQIMREFEDELEKERLARVAPLNEHIRLINASYGGIKAPVTRARLGDNQNVGGLMNMISAFKKKEAARVEAERKRLADEQRAREDEAAAARDALAAKHAAGTPATAAERLEVLKVEDEARNAQARAEAIRPAPIRSALGQVSVTRAIAFDITDVRKLLGWMIKQPLRSGLEAEVRKIMGVYLRSGSIGVNGVARGVTIPGLNAWVTETDVIRR